MSKAFGIINFAGNNIQVNDMQAYRPIGAFSFLGRYRVIDFPISNMSNSGIDVMQVYVRRKPRSLVEHIGTGRHYNINSKRGKLITLFQESNIDNGIYNTDIAAYMENLDCFDEINSEYVVIAPSYMVYTADYSAFLKTHIESGADITLMYHSVDNAKDHFLNCHALDINKQKGVLWFNVQSANIIPIVEFSNTGNKSSYTYPSVWRIGDPIEELDLMLTYMTSPRLIPGMTTKKWGYVSNDDNGTESKQMDLLLVVDTSGSMGSAMKESANMHQAVLASYGILSYFESTKSKVAFIGFSDKIDAYVDWSDKYDDVRERLLTNGHGGTKFPISRIKSTLDVRSRDLVTVLITNGDLGSFGTVFLFAVI